MEVQTAGEVGTSIAGHLVPILHNSTCQGLLTKPKTRPCQLILAMSLSQCTTMERCAASPGRQWDDIWNYHKVGPFPTDWKESQGPSQAGILPAGSLFLSTSLLEIVTAVTEQTSSISLVPR